MAKKFKSGSLIPHSGVYRVIHSEHRLPHEVTALKGERFPVCAQCRNAVVFELLHPVADERKFRVVLHCLPEREESNT